MNHEGATVDEKAATRNGTAGSRRTAPESSGGEAATALKSQKLAEGDKAEAGKGKRLRRVSQEYIDMLLQQKATGTGAYRVSRSMEYIEKYYTGTRDFRSLIARSDALMEKVRAEDAKILEEYGRFGYAYYIPVQEGISDIELEKIRHYLPRWPKAAGPSGSAAIFQ